MQIIVRFPFCIHQTEIASQSVYSFFSYIIKVEEEKKEGQGPAHSMIKSAEGAAGGSSPKAVPTGGTPPMMRESGILTSVTDDFWFADQF